MTKHMFVGICGAPNSGKTSAANVLVEKYGAIIVDDGLPLREACKAIFGLTQEQVGTQEGKKQLIEVNGLMYPVRSLLGELGNFLEDEYGDLIMPWLAMERVKGMYEEPHMFVFPSCRKVQGQAYLAAGGTVIEVVRPGFEAANDFDKYDEEFVQHTIVNDGTIEELGEKVSALFEEILAS